MIKKIFIGIFAGMLLGMFVTSIFLPRENDLLQLFLTKITATSIITGLFVGVYAHLSKSKLQVFFASIVIGVTVFYTKYLITNHDFDSITMGAFIGAMLGGIFAIIRKVTQSYIMYKRLRRHRRKGFGNYS